ncbi:MAG: [protein-PII] uridylyltransferase, partial [Persephonella sp.]
MSKKVVLNVDEIINKFFEEKKKLAEKHRAGAGGLDIVKELANLTDKTIKNLAELSFQNQLDNISIIVLGGYGRRELCFKSDIDISSVVKTD